VASSTVMPPPGLVLTPDGRLVLDALLSKK
jgi:hypothetical protein